MTKQYVKITGPMYDSTWEQTENEGFNKTDKFEVVKINEDGDYEVLAPFGYSWDFPSSSVELVEEQEGQEEPSAESKPIEEKWGGTVNLDSWDLPEGVYKVGYDKPTNGDTPTRVWGDQKGMIVCHETLPKPIEEKMRDTRGTISTNSNPLANVPKLEDCPKMIWDYKGGDQEPFKGQVYILAQINQHIFLATTNRNFRIVDDLKYVVKSDLTPIPTKQPWGQAEFLTQLAKWGTMEGVEVKTDKRPWDKLTSIGSKVAVVQLGFIDLQLISHIRINNGEPVECVK